MPELFRLRVSIDGAGVVSFDKRELHAVLRQAGAEVAGLARNMIRKGAAGGRQYATRRAGAIVGYQASVPGQPPASRTGALASSISVRSTRGGDGVAIRASEPYAKPLEAGAHGGGPGRGNTRQRRGGQWTVTAVAGQRQLEPRPFLSAALDSKRSSIEARLRSTIIGGLAWQKIKP